MTFHSSGNGKICLGTMESGSFREAFKGAVESQRLDKINEMFDEIEKLFTVASIRDAFGNSGYLSNKEDAFHKKVFMLWEYLKGKIDENGNPITEAHEDEEEEEE
jgi:hypothetical protein